MLVRQQPESAGQAAYSVARKRRSLVRLQAARITCAWEGRRAEDPDLLSQRQFYIAGRIRDRLAEEFGKDSVFMDVDSIPRGVDFTEYIADHIRNSDIVIAAIGQNRLGRTEAGSRIQGADDAKLGEFGRIGAGICANLATARAAP